MKILKDKIRALIAEGKLAEDIIATVIEHDEAKKLSQEELVDMILDAQKAEGIKQALKADQKKKNDEVITKKKASEFDEQVKTAVDESLKKIGAPLFGQFSKPKELKIFNPRTGKIEEIKSEVSEAYGALNAMLHCIMNNDLKSATSISNEIDQDNKSYLNDMNTKQFELLNKYGIKAANDSSRSDNDARGAYAVPTEVDMIISQLLYQKSTMLTAMNTDNIIFNDKIYPLMYGITINDIANQNTAITESQETFTNPTINMERAGAYTNISNTFLRQKGADLVNAFVGAYGAAFATFLDNRLAIGNVTTSAHLVDGITFDANTNLPSVVTYASADALTLSNVKNTISENASGEIIFIANRKVTDKFGMIENGAGNLLFPQYINNGTFRPFGIQWITNPKITSVLNIGADAATGGTDDLLLCIAKDYCIAGVSGTTRIDFSEHWRFSDDVTTIRGIKSYGAKVLSSTSTGGIVAVAQELTN